MTCVFECFQSIVTFWKNYMISCVWWVPFFGEDSFMFNFVGYGLVTKSHGAGCTFEKVGGESKMSKDECEF